MAYTTYLIINIKKMNLRSIKEDTTWGEASEVINKNTQIFNKELTKVSLSTLKHKGFFLKGSTLRAAYPSPVIGDNAWVGSVYPGVIHICEAKGVWKATTQIPDVPIVDLTDLSKSANIDGGSADTKYGGAIVIDGGNAEYK